MRLIDADALMKKCNCERNCFDCDFYTDGDSWCQGEVFGIKIMQMPTIDAVEVVRCKDCEYSCDEISYLYCSHGVCDGCEVPPNFYCAEGKRKENET